MVNTYPYTIEFSEMELNRINNALLMLEEAFAGKLIKDVNSEQQGKEPEIENICTIPTDDGTMHTMAVPAFTNIAQWGRDEKAREQLHPIATRLKNIAQQVVNTDRAVLQRCWNSSGKYFE